MERVSLARRAMALPSGMPATESAESISFDSGHAFPGILPDLTEAAQRALTEYRAEALQYAARPGLPEMREWIAGYMNEDGADLGPDEVLVVNGAKHGIDLVCRLLLEEGDTIVVTAPTYYTSIPIFRSFGAEFLEVGQDSEGIDVGEIEESLAWLEREGRKPPKFIYNVPDFHNPTGVTMPLRRRQALVDLCERHGIFVVEDSPYRKVRFEGDDEPSLKSLDRTGSVLNLGTFSKLMAPGLRIGWVAAPRDLVDRMMQLKSDGGSSPLVQRIIVEFCRAGHFAGHTRSVQETYREHRDRMVEALRREMPDALLRVPEGGYYLWLTLPHDIDGDELATRAREAGVITKAGSKFFAGQFRGHPRNQAHPRNHVRLAFSHAALDEIDDGVRRLARAYASMRSG